jgi:circadian clock protein KaiC
MTRPGGREMATRRTGVRKLPTGIDGFDVIARGGIPMRRTTLVSGTAGSGKTIFAVQFLVAGIRDSGESGVFVTFEESADDIRQNMRSFGWDLEHWERDGRLAFVDASPDPEEEVIESGACESSMPSARWAQNESRSTHSARCSPSFPTSRFSVASCSG